MKIFTRLLPFICSARAAPRLLLLSSMIICWLGGAFSAYADSGGSCNATYSVTADGYGKLFLPCVESSDGIIYQASLDQVPGVEQFLFKLNMATATNPPSGINAVFDSSYAGSLFIPVVEVNLGGQTNLYEVQMTVEPQSATGDMTLGVSSASTILANARGRLRVALQTSSSQGTTRKKSDNNGNTKVTICHKGKNTLEVSSNALQAHLNHGDSEGACIIDNDTGGSDSTTTTDDPNQTGNITAIWLDIQQVKVCVADDDCQTIGGSQRINLLDFEMAELANVLLSPASFEQVRLVLGTDNTVVVDGETHPLTIPSGQTSGLKIVKPDDEEWAVEAGFETELRVSLVDVVNSVHSNQGQGYMFKPILKATYDEPIPLEQTPLNDDPANEHTTTTGSVQVNDDNVPTNDSGDTNTPPPDDNNGTEILSTEPFILTVDDDNDIYGLTLTIAPGAHPDPSSLSARITVDTTTRLTPVYKLEPEGTKFLVPVTVTLKYNPEALGGVSTDDAGFSPDDIAVLHNGAGIETIVDAENHTISAEIMHFSDAQAGITQNCQKEDTLTKDIFSDVKLKDFYVNSARKLCRFGILHGKFVNGKRIVDPWAKTRVIEVLKVLLSAINSKNRYSGKNWTEIMKKIRSDAEKSLPKETIPPSGEAIERGVVIRWISKLFFSNISEADAVKRMVEEGITNGVRMFAKDVISDDAEYKHCYDEQGTLIDNEGGFDEQGNKKGDGVVDCVQVNRAELVTLAYRLMNLSRTVNPHGGEQFGDKEQRAAGYRDRETVVLLLHGLNSNAGTWNDLVTNHPTFGNHCPSISVNTIGELTSLNGKINIGVNRTKEYEGVFCYRLNFGASDTAAGQDQGLENVTCDSTTNGCGGDWSTFNQLGQEVQAAVNFIKDRQGHETQIILLGHSRGGLAARAFLQSSVAKRANENRSVRDNTVSMITTGTPHRGSPFGRIYQYMAGNCINDDGTRNTTENSNCEQDWKAMSYLLSEGLDIRRPSINYLSDNSTNIIRLNNNVTDLPNIDYGTLVYNGVPFGILGTKFTIEYSVFDRELINDVKEQISNANTTKAVDMSAQEAILGAANNVGNPPDTHVGDGIVPANRQQLDNIDNWPQSLTVNEVLNSDEVLHTDEPEQRADITAALDALYDRLTNAAQQATQQ